MTITPPGGTQINIGTFDKVELTPIHADDVTFDDVKFNPTVLPFLSKGDSVGVAWAKLKKHDRGYRGTRSFTSIYWLTASRCACAT